ncbi:MAG TPA: prepilin-type N-terminal cleavage/methylation domain-containing protein [Candidatus Paceibacterota bacterium]
MWTYFKCFLFSGHRGKASKPKAAGFTLIELLVVSLIIVLITGTLIFRQQGFNSSTLLRSLSYSVALSLRQAQVYGVSVRENAAGSGTFASGYGVFFGNTLVDSANHYVLFADKGNGVLDLGTNNLPDANGNNICDTNEDCLAQRFTIGNGRSAGADYTIRNYCAHVINGSDQCKCTSASQCTVTSPSITSLTVYFRRPNPDACFATSQNPAACAPGAAAIYDYAYIQLKSAGSTDWRTIKVSSTGQIAVCKQNIDAAGVAAC